MVWIFCSILSIVDGANFITLMKENVWSALSWNTVAMFSSLPDKLEWASASHRSPDDLFNSSELDSGIGGFSLPDTLEVTSASHRSLDDLPKSSDPDSGIASIGSLLNEKLQEKKRRERPSNFLN